MGTIKIVNGKRGYHLMINGLYISHGFDSEIKAIESLYGIPYGATEWISIQAIRNFWHKYMITIISNSMLRPYRSIWGRLELIEK